MEMKTKKYLTHEEALITPGIHLPHNTDLHDTVLDEFGNKQICLEELMRAISRFARFINEDESFRPTFGRPDSMVTEIEPVGTPDGRDTFLEKVPYKVIA